MIHPLKAASFFVLLSALALAQKTPDLALEASPISPDKRAGSSFAPIIRKVAPPVVHISRNKSNRSAPMHGDILTHHHVIEGSSALRLMISKVRPDSEIPSVVFLNRKKLDLTLSIGGSMSK